MPLGDSAFLIKLGDTISIDINRQINTLVRELAKANIKGIIELIPAYNELMVCYNPLEINYNMLIKQLRHIESNLKNISLPPTLTLHIPVCYESEFAADIDIVANTNHLTKEKLIQIHTATPYLVYMLGFTPGFCYLGQMDKRLSTPRKSLPRLNIESGSVGIAGNQTGIYPIDSPGGWQIIGKTPIKLFAPKRKPEILIQAGNYIKFYSISSTEFNEIKKLIDKDNFELIKEINHA